MKISELAKDARRLEIVYTVGEQKYPVNVEYWTQAITIGLLREIRDATTDEQILTQFVRLVKRWDLTDDNDNEIPITVEGLVKNEVPFFLLTTILSAIHADRAMSDDEKKA